MQPSQRQRVSRATTGILRAGWTPGWRSVIVFLALALLAHLTGWGDDVGREVFRR